MRIGIVTTWFERGAAYVSLAYKQALEAAGHKVFIFARGGEIQAKGDSKWDGVEVTWAKKSILMDESGIDLKQFKRWLETERIAAVLFNEQHSWGPVLLCQDLGIPTLSYIDYYTKDTVSLFGNYDALICNTRRHNSAFDWHSGARYIPWGVDTDLFRPKPERRKGRAGSGNVIFFHSCGMSPVRKGTDLLIRAVARMQDSTSRLVIHAQKNIYELLPDDVETIGRHLEDCGRLQMVNKTVPAPGLYHMGDVYVYPTRLEGIGLTICESLACGLSVIVPDNAPMNEFVENEDHGFKVRVAEYYDRHDGYYWPSCIVDVEHLAQQLDWCAANPAKVAAMKDSARTYALAHRNWKSQYAAVGEIFESLEILTGLARADARKAADQTLMLKHRIIVFIDVNARRLAKKSKTLQSLHDRLIAWLETRHAKRR